MKDYSTSVKSLSVPLVMTISGYLLLFGVIMALGKIAITQSLENEKNMLKTELRKELIKPIMDEVVQIKDKLETIRSEGRTGAFGKAHYSILKNLVKKEFKIDIWPYDQIHEEVLRRESYLK